MTTPCSNRHQRQRGVRFPRRRSGRPDAGLPVGRRARGADRAQVSYRDLAGFGRRFIDVAAEDLVADVVYQIGALQAIAEAAGSAVSYVKPHGALYNTIVTHREQAAAVAEAVRLVDAGVAGAGHDGFGVFDEAARRGLRTVAEAFADGPTGRTASWFPARTRCGVARPGADRGAGGDHGER